MVARLTRTAWRSTMETSATDVWSAAMASVSRTQAQRSVMPIQATLHDREPRPGEGACTSVNLPSGMACDDGDACTPNDRCEEGVSLATDNL